MDANGRVEVSRFEHRGGGTAYLTRYSAAVFSTIRAVYFGLLDQWRALSIQNQGERQEERGGRVASLLGVESQYGARTRSPWS